MTNPHASYFPRWTLREEGVIAPDERLPLGATLALGVQHVVAMFGATVLAPLLMGFDPNVAILFSGVGTLIFFVGRRRARAELPGLELLVHRRGDRRHRLCGERSECQPAGCTRRDHRRRRAYAAIGLVVMKAGYAWIERLMPPVVTGAIVAVIGLNLAPIAVKSIAGSAFDTWVGIATIAAVGLVAVRRPRLRGPPADPARRTCRLSALRAPRQRLRFGQAHRFRERCRGPVDRPAAIPAPVWNAQAIGLIAPVAIILVAENLGHVKAVAAMTGRNLDPYLGRAFLGDGIATIVAGAGGGTGVTTYAENIGVMAVTKIYSTIVFVVAALTAIVLGFSPKFGAMIMTIPGPVLGGLAIVVFGLITATGARIWVQNGVDFANARNLVTVAATLTIGAGDLALKIGGFTLGGIGTATFGAICCISFGETEPKGEVAAIVRSFAKRILRSVGMSQCRKPR